MTVGPVCRRGGRGSATGGCDEKRGRQELGELAFEDGLARDDERGLVDGLRVGGRRRRR